MHQHAPHDYSRAFAFGVALNLFYVIAEAAVGLAIGSLALLADAGHNLGDVLGLSLAWLAHRLMHVRPSPRRTYGWRSSSILAALFNSLLLLVAVGGIGWEAIRRFMDPADVPGLVIASVAVVGVIINTATALLFLRGRHEDLNIRGAFLHMTADAAISGGVAIAGLGIVATHWVWLDPVTSLVIAGVILLGTWGLLKDSFDLASHAVPAGVDSAAVGEYLAGRPGVTEVHDLHIWALSTTETALTAHLVRPGTGDDDAFLEETSRQLHDQFHIDHPTLQVERTPGNCRLAAAGCRPARGSIADESKHDH